MALKLLTLNIEQDRHLPQVLSLLRKENPDAACLQEIFQDDFIFLKKETGMLGTFIPAFSELKPLDRSRRELQGIALLTKLNCNWVQHRFYHGKGTCPKYTGPNSVDRVILFAELEKKGKKYVIGTTHFTWAGKGGTNRSQHLDFQNLIGITQRIGSLVLCGDFNSPRGGKIYSAFTRYLQDNIPKKVKTTLDPELHRNGALQYVVDAIFSTRDYKVSKVRTISGVSDHKAVVGEVERCR